MIHYFKLVTEGYTFTLGQTYLRQESPKGELGCYIVHGQTTHPCRVSIRTPDYTNLQAVHVLSTDHYVADLIATLGTADIVLGSVDKKIKTCSNGLPLYNMYSSLIYGITLFLSWGIYPSLCTPLERYLVGLTSIG